MMTAAWFGYLVIGELHNSVLMYGTALQG